MMKSTSTGAAAPSPDHAGEILAVLKRVYPRAPKTALEHRTPLEMLVATILSAQCTDARVNVVTRELFRKYRTAEDYANARQEDLEKDIRSTGFYRNKAKNIRGAAGRIVEEYGGEVPDTMDDLLTLPGVARKTANIVLFAAFDRVEGIAVDTHVKRLSYRMGLTGNTDPVKIERDLMDAYPRGDWSSVNRVFVEHGRAVCRARKPRCDECQVKHICPRNGL
ncbi:MAG: endonuclease III [Candidatus Altiarchaeales archaeon]|nr:endonuclease III [Candidatus Altiarchaeales archaeon]MBD3416145.1 endonuclease III [Candidatus Altiarchaeales archaeon]